MNSRLNYGYSIVRGCVAKSLAAHGFLLSKGIHHESSLNALNHVDDMIEPFRAFVDLNSTRIQSNQIRLTREERKILMETLYMECKIDNKYTTVQNAIEIMVFRGPEISPSENGTNSNFVKYIIDEAGVKL